MTVEEIKQILISSNYKLTKQREIIIQVLINHSDSLITADTILAKSALSNSSINLTTIYRNLELLFNMSLIYKLTSNDGTQRYKIVCNDHHHHHIICTECGKTDIIDFCPMEKLHQLSRDKGYYLQDHKIELYGVCQTCSIQKAT